MMRAIGLWRNAQCAQCGAQLNDPSALGRWRARPGPSWLAPAASEAFVNGSGKPTDLTEMRVKRSWTESGFRWWRAALGRLAAMPQDLPSLAAFDAVRDKR